MDGRTDGCIDRQTDRHQNSKSNTLENWLELATPCFVHYDGPSSPQLQTPRAFSVPVLFWTTYSQARQGPPPVTHPVPDGSRLLSTRLMDTFPGPVRDWPGTVSLQRPISCLICLSTLLDKSVHWCIWQPDPTSFWGVMFWGWG